MNKTITIVTSNKGKFQELKRYILLHDPSMNVEQSSIELPEQQDMNIRNVALGKALHAWELIKKPLLIDDGGIYIEKYNQFPGVFSKYVYEGIGLDGIWKLAQDDPRCYFLNCLVFIWGPTSYEFFEGKTHGQLIAPVASTLNNPLPYRSIFIPEGFDLTLEQLWNTQDNQEYNHRYKAVHQFMAWHKNHPNS